MIADISSGNTDWADIFFLVGFLLFLGATYLIAKVVPTTIGWAVATFGLAAVALGWLVL